MTNAIDQAKIDLRRAAESRRAEATARSPNAGSQIAGRILSEVPTPRGAVVSGYWPMGSEVDPRRAMMAFAERGHRLCLPVVVRRGESLRFRSWQAGEELVPAGFGTRVPSEGSPELIPDVLLVPLLAFDRRGYRLGYGGGFYDRTLEALRPGRKVLAVGLAFAAQQVAEVPVHAGDQRLDWVVTEQSAICFSANVGDEHV